MTSVPSVAQSLEDVLWAYPELYGATEYTEPEWLDTFRNQISYGVTAADLHLTGYSQLGRGRVIALDDQLIMAWNQLPDSADRIPDPEPVIEKLACQYRNERSEFERFVKKAEHIDSTANIVIDAVEDWIEDHPSINVPPVKESARELIQDYTTGSETVSRIDTLLNRENTPDTETNPDSGSRSVTPTSDDDSRETSLSEFF